MKFKSRKLFAILIITAMVLAMLPVGTVFAAVTVTPAALTTVTAGVNTNLGGAIVLAEGVAGDLGVGNIVITAPAGVTFNTAVTPDVVVAVGGDISLGGVTVTASTITIPVTAVSAAASTLTIGGGILPQVYSTTPGSYDLTVAAVGLASTSCGPITVNPAAASIAASILELSHSSRKADGSKATATVALRDRFNNPTTDLGGHSLYIWVERATKAVSDAETLTELVAYPGTVPAVANKAIGLWLAAPGGLVKVDISSLIAGSTTVKAAIGSVSAGTIQSDIVETTSIHMNSIGLTFTSLAVGNVNLSKVDDSPLTANGVAKSAITATVTDSSGNPVSGQTVNFSVNKTGATLNHTTRTTNLLGQASVNLTADRATAYTVTAAVGNVDNTIVVTFVGGSGTTIEKLADITAKVAKGYETGWFSVSVKDAFGNKVSNPVVNYTFTSKPSDSGLTDSSLTAGSFDDNSNSRSRFTPDVVGTYVVRATLTGGQFVAFTIEAAEMGVATGLTLSYRELSLPHNGLSGAPSLKYVDANGITRDLSSSEKLNVTISSSNVLLATINADKKVQATDVTTRKGSVTITAVDTSKNFVASFDMLIGTTPVVVELTPAASMFEVNTAGKVTLQLKDGDGNNIAYGVDSTKNRNVDIRVISKPAGAVVETSAPSAFDVNNALERTGKVEFTVTSDKEGTVSLQVLVGDGGSPQQFLTKNVTVNFGPVAPPAPEFNVFMFIGSNSYVADGQPGSMDVAPFIEDGRTFVPVRFVAEAFGAEADWGPKDGATEWVTLTNGDMVITITIGEYTIEVVNGDETETVVSDVVAFIRDGRTFLPLRAIGEIFGAEFDWGPKDAATEWVSFS